MAASASIYAFLVFFKPVLRTMFFPSQWLLFHITIVETTDSGERGMNPIAKTIINILGMNICRAGDLTSNLLFSSPQCYQLSYGAQPPHSPDSLTTLYKKPFENIVGNTENAGNQHFLLFPQCFLSFLEQIPIFQSYLFCHLQILSNWTTLFFQTGLI